MPREFPNPTTEAVNTKSSSASAKALKIWRDFEKRRQLRSNWEDHWNQIAKRVIPSHRDLFTQAKSSVNLFSKGRRKTEFVLDSTAALALDKFTSILDSLLTPRNQRWHKLQASNPEKNKDREVKLWMETANRALFKFRYSPQANFASQNQMVYQSLGAYGTGGLFTDPHTSGLGTRYKNIHLGEIFGRENHQGVVNTVYRYFPLSAWQAIDQFGEENLPSDIVQAAKGKDPDAEFFFLHAVVPRLDPDIERMDFRGMPWASFYISEKNKTLVEEGGFRSFPYAIPRYRQTANEFYGRSPAMEVLPAIKMLNEQKRTLIKQGHRAVDPVLLAHDDGVVDSFSLMPGKVNYGGVSAQGRALVHALPVGRIDIGKDLMDDERVLINDTFLVNLFQILTDNPTMTATEVLERTKEKGILLAPTVGRQQSEYLGPMIERELSILSTQGIIPPPPLALLEGNEPEDFDIVYDSPLSRAQRAEEAAGLFRSVQAALDVVNTTGDMSPLDHFNWDVIMPEIAAIHGVPISWLNSPQDLLRLRDQRAQDKQLQQAATLAPGAAAMTNAVSGIAS